nr:MAG TPA: helix-turn-helix domain protein [Caudoviricetes sp.]
MNRVDKVYEYMKSHDGITSMEAIYKLEETRLSGRIFDLKKHLLAIGDKERVVDEFEYGKNGKKWKRYRIIHTVN